MNPEPMSPREFIKDQFPTANPRILSDVIKMLDRIEMAKKGYIVVDDEKEVQNAS